MFRYCKFLFSAVCLFFLLTFSAACRGLPIHSEEISSITIYSYDEGRTTKQKIYETSDKLKIKKIRRLFSTLKGAPQYKCGYSGIVEFKTIKGIFELKYNLEDDCQHFIYLKEGAVISKKLSEDAVDFLKSPE